MIFRNVTIKQKLETIMLITTAAVLVPCILAFMFLETVSARDEAIIRFDSLATVLAANSSAALAFRDEKAALEVLNSLSSQTDVLWAGIQLLDGSTFIEYRAANYENGPESDLWPSILAPILDNIEVKKAITLDNSRLGDFIIIGDMSRLLNSLMQQVYVGLGMFIVAMLSALILADRLQRVVSEPVRRLLGTMHRVVKGNNFSHRAERVSNDELGTLVDGFNEMLKQIQQYDEKINSHQKQLEKEVIARTQELEEAKLQAESASQAKSLFLATMSHEIRTPLNGVVGMIQVLRSTSLTSQQKKYLETLDSSSKALTMLIDDLLDLSRIESGKLVLDVETFATRRWIHDIKNLVSPLFEDKDVELEIKVSPDLPEFLRGDSARLLQIVVNLVSNAAKFTRFGRVILNLSGQPSSEGYYDLLLSVEDTGIGIQEDKLDLIFKAFQQLEVNQITNKGVGLGLAICKRLTDLMQGSLRVTSQPEEGSCFTFEVSLAQAEEMVEKTQDTQALDIPRNLHVLLVDDDSINRFVARSLLEHEGLTVTEARNGQIAIEKVRAQSFDLILMDIQMPVMDGISATEIIRQEESEAHRTPIIGVSASVMSDDKKRYLRAGMDAVVEKPLVLDNLIRTILKLI